MHCRVNRWSTLGLASFVLLFGGCRVLQPSTINATRNNLPSELTRADESQIERGQPRPLIDGFGWLWGIPSKVVLWNAKVENHDISRETEQVLAEYLAANHLDEIKVRANQYRPLDDWKRLTRNKSVAWPWRYSIGTLSVLGETVIPGRLFGGDHYNPFTGTIHLYSDLPSVALHEAAHAKDFSRRKHPGTYAAVYGLPFVPLWHERVATNDVLAYVEARGELGLRQEAYHVLFPAYGTYVGSSIGNFSGPAALPLTVGGALVGHVVGRERAAKLGNEMIYTDTSVATQK